MGELDHQAGSCPLLILWLPAHTCCQFPRGSTAGALHPAWTLPLLLVILLSAWGGETIPTVQPKNLNLGNYFYRAFSLASFLVVFFAEAVPPALLREQSCHRCGPTFSHSTRPSGLSPDTAAGARGPQGCCGLPTAKAALQCSLRLPHVPGHSACCS